MQIVTGIEVNSGAYLRKLREYCPSAEGMLAIFPQLGEIILTTDRWWNTNHFRFWPNTYAYCKKVWFWFLNGVVLPSV